MHVHLCDTNILHFYFIKQKYVRHLNSIKYNPPSKSLMHYTIHPSNSCRSFSCIISFNILNFYRHLGGSPLMVCEKLAEPWTWPKYIFLFGFESLFLKSNLASIWESLSHPPTHTQNPHRALDQEPHPRHLPPCPPSLHGEEMTPCHKRGHSRA